MLEQVGRYRIVSTLGRGAMGLVYLADDPALNRQVAIKTLDLTLGASSDREFLRERLLRDAKAAAALSHPNIVSVYDVLEEGDCAYVVMEYISGENLEDHLAKQPIPPSSFTVAVLRQISAALDYTHSRGIIHRDIKPGNVMIAADGAAKLLDFGIARLSDGRTTTPTGQVMGTVEYMAPEQIKGETVEGQADQFSLAAVAYRMLSGRPLYGQLPLAALAYKLVHEKAPSIRSVNPSLPMAMDAVFDRALSKNPRDRFATCSEFAEAVANGFAVSAPVRKPHNRLALAGVVGACVLAAGVGYFIRTTKSQPAANPMEVVVDSPPTQEPVQLPSQKPAVKIAAKTTTKTAAKVAPPKKDPPPDEKTEKPETPEQTDHPVVVAQEQMKKGDYAGAIQTLTEAIALHPKRYYAHHLRGLAYQNLQKNDEAIADYTEAIRLNPGDALSYADRGLCYNRIHKDDLAFEDLNHALSIRQDLPAALNGRGLYYLRHNEFAKAIQDCDAALKLSPNYWQAYQNRGRARRGLGDEAGATADLNKAKELRKGPE